MTQRQRATSVALVLLVTIASIWLAAELPPRAFYSGDSGVKLIAARSAIAHPSLPFEIDLPEIAGRPVPYVERFFAVHGQHAHALPSGRSQRGVGVVARTGRRQHPGSGCRPLRARAPIDLPRRDVRILKVICPPKE